ncbi:MBL fold metallo-hydrolase [Rhodococcus sp. SJ-3]|uniref:MBL fold metallo-hydrolase n=1 Tax=Rhodococcus sp. SJ-3 TaxID=3454628 RepID=UPI003F7A5210
MTWIDPHNGSDRARHGIATAVVVGDAFYLVDCGMGVAHQLRMAQLGQSGDFHGYEGLRDIFLTHLHSDHTMDYFNIVLSGWYHGLPGPEPVGVYGPGDRGALPAITGPSDVAAVNPDNPTPGTVDMTTYLTQAFATDINDRLRDSGKPSLDHLIRTHDIDIPAQVGARANDNQFPDMDPFVIMEDDRVKVSATLVDHGAVYPAFAFRFDTDDGSITFSGDTAPSPNLVRLAQETDILVHEVIDADWVRALYGEPPYSPEEEGFIEHLLHSHTTIEQVGPIAEQAGAKSLVLSHLAPGNNPRERWLAASAGFSGDLIVGEDLMQVGIGARTS